MTAAAWSVCCAAASTRVQPGPQEIDHAARHRPRVTFSPFAALRQRLEVSGQEQRQPLRLVVEPTGDAVRQGGAGSGQVTHHIEHIGQRQAIQGERSADVRALRLGHQAAQP